MSDPTVFSGNRRRGLSEQDLVQHRTRVLSGMERILAQKKYKTVVISAEMITALPPDAIASTYKWLNQRSDELMAGGYVREPYSFVESMFQTAVRNGRANFDIDKYYPRYRQRFLRLEKAFGPSSVKYFAYTPSDFPDGNVVVDFAHRFGISTVDWEFQRRNQSFSRDALSLLYVYRKFAPKPEKNPLAVRGQAYLIRELEKIPGEKTRLAHEIVQPVIEANRADIEWMEGRLGQSLAGDPSRSGEGLREEADLLKLSESALAWVEANAPGPLNIGNARSPNLEGVADAVHRFYMQLSTGDRRIKKRRPVQKSV
jgi:hypothetical protein